MREEKKGALKIKGNYSPSRQQGKAILYLRIVKHVNAIILNVPILISICWTSNSATSWFDSLECHYLTLFIFHLLLLITPSTLSIPPFWPPPIFSLPVFYSFFFPIVKIQRTESPEFRIISFSTFCEKIPKTPTWILRILPCKLEPVQFSILMQVSFSLNLLRSSEEVRHFVNCKPTPMRTQGFFAGGKRK